MAQQHLPAADFNWDLDHVDAVRRGRQARPAGGGARAGARLVSDPAQHAAWLQELVELGFDEVYLHHVGQEQREWLDVFGEQVLPQLDVTAKVAA